MSLSAPPTPGPTPASAPKAKSFDPVASLLDERISEAQNALWWAELVRGTLKTVLGSFAAIGAWVIFDQWVYSPGYLGRVLFFSLLVAWMVSRFFYRILPVLRSTIRPEYATRSIERDNPDMRQELTSYVTLHHQQDDSALRGKVIRSVGAHAANRLRQHDALPTEATGTLTWWIATALMMGVIVVYAFVSPKSSVQSARRLFSPIASIAPAKRVAIADVVPGNRDAIAGRSVAVSARVNGLRRDEPVWCRWQLADRTDEVELLYDAESGRHLGEISIDHSVSGVVPYWLVAGDDQAGPFRLRVQDVPVVAIESIRYAPPAYTGTRPHTSSSAAITGVDGTVVTIRARTNRAVEKAYVQFNPKPLGDSVNATAGTMEMAIDDMGMLVTASFPLRRVKERSAAVQLESYRIQVSDSGGQTNPTPIVYPIRVIADLAPEITIALPQQSPKDLSIEDQQVFEIHAADADFGLSRIDLEIRRGIDVLARPTLWQSDVGAKGNQIAIYRFRPIEHFLRVGDAVRVVAVAKDNRRDENDSKLEPNVTKTDPVELRITMSQPLPDQPDASDGVSAADDQPAVDPSSKEQQGESGGGASGGGEGAAGQQQAGDPQSGESGSGGSGNEGESQPSSPPQNGSDGSQDASENESQHDGQGGGSSNGGDAGSDRSHAESNASNQDQDGSGDSTGEPSMGEESPAEDGGETTPDDGSSNQNGTGASDSDSRGPPSQNSNASPSDPSSGGQPSGDPLSDNGSSQAPKHDGETIERIRDYLEKKRQEQAGGQAAKEESNQQGRPENDPAATPDTEGMPSEDAGTEQGEPPSDPRSSATENASGTSGDEGQPRQRNGNASQSSESANSARTGGDTADASQQSDSGSADAAQDSEQGDSEQGDSEQGDSEQGDSGQESESPDAGKPSGSDSLEKPDQPKGDSMAHDPQDPSPPGQSTPNPSADESSSAGADAASGSNTAAASAEGASREPAETSENSQAEPSESDERSEASRSQANEGQSTRSDPQSDERRSEDPRAAAAMPSQGSGGDGAGTEGGDETNDPPPPPDPVDLQYAKQATDMVLDYLEETRDEPDQALLEDLNWTEQDLRQFAERWKKVRNLDQANPIDPQTQRDFSETLESLGIRKPGKTTSQRREQADALRGLKDSGNRTPPPAAYRDAFEAFRRVIGRQTP
ncbi:hypothetical protein [Novipirellula artificiosorum]|uniref:Uncharacterized protein n=1 Tax=Novipirellula artificiosorum TaxID=2528016 RepID=A0A5C6DHQ3_9BACT|nr:hypothetical protein [Novipirellula artificiosorum]TWU34489.1 hypothetical protein Poly41_46370 [Novipirellula artificiosorum]